MLIKAHFLTYWNSCASLSLNKTLHVWLPHTKTFYCYGVRSKLYAIILWCVISLKLNIGFFVSLTLMCLLATNI